MKQDPLEMQYEPSFLMLGFFYVMIRRLSFPLPSPYRGTVMPKQMIILDFP